VVRSDHISIVTISAEEEIRRHKLREQEDNHMLFKKLIVSVNCGASLQLGHARHSVGGSGLVRKNFTIKDSGSPGDVF